MLAASFEHWQTIFPYKNEKKNPQPPFPSSPTSQLSKNHRFSCFSQHISLSGLNPLFLFACAPFSRMTEDSVDKMSMGASEGLSEAPKGLVSSSDQAAKNVTDVAPMITVTKPTEVVSEKGLKETLKGASKREVLKSPEEHLRMVQARASQLTSKGPPRDAPRAPRGRHVYNKYYCKISVFPNSRTLLEVKRNISHLYPPHFPIIFHSTQFLPFKNANMLK